MLRQDVCMGMMHGLCLVEVNSFETVDACNETLAWSSMVRRLVKSDES